MTHWIRLTNPKNLTERSDCFVCNVGVKKTAINKLYSKKMKIEKLHMKSTFLIIQVEKRKQTFISAIGKLGPLLNLALEYKLSFAVNFN